MEAEASANTDCPSGRSGNTLAKLADAEAARDDAWLYKLSVCSAKLSGVTDTPTAFAASRVA
jgi:hypothetical protein